MINNTKYWQLIELKWLWIKMIIKYFSNNKSIPYRKIALGIAIVDSWVPVFPAGGNSFATPAWSDGSLVTPGGSLIVTTPPVNYAPVHTGSHGTCWFTWDILSHIAYKRITSHLSTSWWWLTTIKPYVTSTYTGTGYVTIEQHAVPVDSPFGLGVPAWILASAKIHVTFLE